MNHRQQSDNFSKIMEGFGQARRAKKGEEELLITSTNLNGLTEEREEEIMNLVDDDIDVMLFQETHRREDSLEKGLKFRGTSHTRMKGWGMPNREGVWPSILRRRLCQMCGRDCLEMRRR